MDGHQAPLSMYRGQMMWSMVEKEECASLSYVYVELVGLRCKCEETKSQAFSMMRRWIPVHLVEHDMGPPKAPKSALKSPKAITLQPGGISSIAAPEQHSPGTYTRDCPFLKLSWY